MEKRSSKTDEELEERIKKLYVKGVEIIDDEPFIVRDLLDEVGDLTIYEIGRLHNIWVTQHNGRILESMGIQRLV